MRFSVKKSLKYGLLALLPLCFASFPVKAELKNDAPVLVEVFSTSTCKFDPGLQERIYNRLGRDKNIILVNCHKYFKSNNEADIDKYSRQFCEDRSIGYFRKLMMFTVNTPMVVVNGMLEANNNDIDAAIDAGRSLVKLEHIEVSRSGDVLNVHVPAGVKGTKGHGKVMLYTYLPTQNAQKILEVDPDVELTKDMEEKIALGQSVPFVTQKRVEPLDLRPTIGYLPAAQWTGKEMSFSVPIFELDAFLANRNDLSFVAVLHDGDEFDPVLAVGEWKAMEDVDHPQKPSSAPKAVMASFPVQAVR